MTVESYYVIAIATLSDWLKRLAPVFQPMRRKTKTNRTMHAWFFPRSERVTGKLLGIVIGSSRCLHLLWLIVVIALALVFRQSFENRSRRPRKSVVNGRLITLLCNCFSLPWLHDKKGMYSSLDYERESAPRRFQREWNMPEWWDENINGTKGIGKKT